MSQDDPLVILLVVGLTGYIFSIWWNDFRRTQSQGVPPPGAFPGTFRCSLTAVVIAVIGALALLAAETGGEYALGISAQQKNITVLYLAAMISAAFGEELVFRGFLVVTRRGRLALLASILGFSLLFSLLHPFLWDWKDGGVGLTFDFSLKAWWSTSVVFACSLWFYTVRFYKLNPKNSLLPCFAAHLAKNLGVFAIKLAQGHVSSWW